MARSSRDRSKHGEHDRNATNGSPQALWTYSPPDSSTESSGSSIKGVRWSPEMHKAIGADLQQSLNFKNTLLNFEVADPMETKERKKLKEREAKKASRTNKKNQSKGMVVQLPRKFDPHIISSDGEDIAMIDCTGEYGTGMVFGSKTRYTPDINYEHERFDMPNTQMKGQPTSPPKNNHEKDEWDNHVTFDLRSPWDVLSSKKAPKLSPRKFGSPRAKQVDEGWGADITETSPPKNNHKKDDWERHVAFDLRSPWNSSSSRKASKLSPKKFESPKAKQSDEGWGADIAETSPTKQWFQQYMAKKNPTNPVRNISSTKVEGPPPAFTTNASVPRGGRTLVATPRIGWGEWSTTSGYDHTSTTTTSSHSVQRSPRPDSDWGKDLTTKLVGPDDGLLEGPVPYSWRRNMEDESIHSNAGSSTAPAPSDAGPRISWGAGKKQSGRNTLHARSPSTGSNYRAPYVEDASDSTDRKHGSKNKTPGFKRSENDSDSSTTWGRKLKGNHGTVPAKESWDRSGYYENNDTWLNATTSKGTRYRMSEYSTPTSWRDV